MTKPLTDTQRVILANAAARDDGRIFPVPTTLNKNSGAITLSLRPLVSAGLIAEIAAQKSDTVWGQTVEDAPTTLAITEQGLIAVGVQPEEVRSLETLPASTTGRKPPSPTSKLGIVIACLRQPDGATLDALVEATGWQKHSVRGAISGALKVKHKLMVQSEVVDGKGRVYRITEGQSEPAAATSDTISVNPEAAAQS